MQSMCVKPHILQIFQNMYHKVQKEQLTYFAQMDARNYKDEEI